MRSRAGGPPSTQVIPLSPNSGLISWVANCDTLHALIKEHRDARKARYAMPSDAITPR